MEYDDTTRGAAAQDLHRTALTCLAAMRARIDPQTIAAVAGEHPQLSLGVELRTAAPTLLLLAKAEGEFLPQLVTRIEMGSFSPDEIKLASVAAAVAAILLQDIAAEARQQAIRLLKAGDAFLSLYVRPEPYEASLELHAGIEVTELARVANQQVNATLQ